MTELDTQLKWFPVWTNIYYFVFAFISFFIIWYKKNVFSKEIKVIIFFLFLEGVISTVHHLTSVEFKETEDVPTYSKVLTIVDEAFVWILLLGPFILMYKTYTRTPHKTIMNLALFSLFIVTAIMAIACYFLDLHFEHKYKSPENYEMYDIFHGEWHTLSAFSYVFCFLFIIYNSKDNS